MKKIILALAAVAAVSTAALAENRSQDLRDTDTYAGKYSVQSDVQTTDSNALAVVEGKASLTAYERQLLNAEINDHGGR